MLFTSPVYSQASGSLAGLTYSHGRSGLVVKPRGTPTNPNSQRQRTIRHAMARLAPYWGQELTPTQRSGWNQYASNVAMSNKLGQTIFLTGHQHFMRSNVARIQSPGAIVPDAPEIYDLGTFTAPTIQAAFRFFNTLTILWIATDEWAGEPGSYMLVQGGRPAGPGRNFFRQPFRYIDSVYGLDPPGFPPTSFTSSWPYWPGNQVWARIRVSRIDGRLSLPVILGPQVIALGP